MTQRIAWVFKAWTGIFLGLALAQSQTLAQTDTPAALQQAFAQGKELSAKGDHLRAAVVYFNVYTAPDSPLQTAALARLTESLVLADMPNAASYFFIKTLQSGDRNSIRRVLNHLPDMVEAVSVDLLRPYILRHTTEADYDANVRSHFYYFLAKDDLLKGEPEKALQALSKVMSGAGVTAQAGYLRGAAYAMIGQNENAIESFKGCRRMAGRGVARTKFRKKEFEDLEARCTAGLARAYYQAGHHDRAEEAYDEVPKASFVWTDILFEQAWNSYAKADYNRALGKLVTYRSPSLGFVFNPEVDVLRAQSFLAMCHYDDVNKTLNEFNRSYAGVGEKMKSFLVAHDRDLGWFYGFAKQVFYQKLHTTDMLNRALNRFIRGPYFAALIQQERMAQHEGARIHRFTDQQGHQRFGAFLEKVVLWRAKTVRLLGGLFVRNSMYDLYGDLLADLDKMSFIKLEMLKRTKQTLERKQVMSEDEDGVMKRGSADIDRKDYQYFWTFNGEFWLDELGDYVFALESQCGS